MLTSVDSQTGNYQCGFRAGKSTKDQIFCLHQILEKSMEFNVGTHNIFIDFKAAFHCINRNYLSEAMNTFKIPSKPIKLTRLTLKDTKCKIKFLGYLSENLDTFTGVQQGDSFSCLLFTIALERVSDSSINTSGHIFTRLVQLLAYADDIDVIARSFHAVKETFLAFQVAARQVSLVINVEKTKYMLFSRPKPLS
ncbi:uncharacterized protein [Parasteatoda tepidariorum]|uniref:uncharacterized protein n=1 Tax=Parasteatoda tepidariorum TaxID=114398 RepID=UPI0039BC7A87